MLQLGGEDGDDKPDPNTAELPLLDNIDEDEIEALVGHLDEYEGYEGNPEEMEEELQVQQQQQQQSSLMGGSLGAGGAPQGYGGQAGNDTYYPGQQYAQSGGFVNYGQEAAPKQPPPPARPQEGGGGGF